MDDVGTMSVRMVDSNRLFLLAMILCNVVLDMSL